MPQGGLHNAPVVVAVVVAVVGIAMPRKWPSLLAPALCSIHRSRFIISASHLSRVFSALRYWVTLYRVSIPIIDSVPPSTPSYSPLPISRICDPREQSSFAICNPQIRYSSFVIPNSQFLQSTAAISTFPSSRQQFLPAIPTVDFRSLFSISGLR